MARDIYYAVKAIFEGSVIKSKHGYFCLDEAGNEINMDGLREVLAPITGIRRERYPQDDFVAPRYMGSSIRKRLDLYEAHLAQNPDSPDDLNVVFDRWVEIERERIEDIIRAKQNEMVLANPCLEGVEWRKAVYPGNLAVQREIWKDGEMIASADTSDVAAKKAIFALATTKPVWARTFAEFTLGAIVFPVVQGFRTKKRVVVDNDAMRGDPDSLHRVQVALKECFGEESGKVLSSMLDLGLKDADIKSYYPFGGERGPVFIMHRSGVSVNHRMLREIWASGVMEGIETGKDVPAVVRKEIGLPGVEAKVASKPSASMGM